MSKSKHDHARAGTGMSVTVRDNNIDQAIRVLKKKLQREGVFREMKLKQHYVSNGQQRIIDQDVAVKRIRKEAMKAFTSQGLTKEEAAQAVKDKVPAPRKSKYIKSPLVRLLPR